MFTIVGTPESTERALMLLYSQLESEKERREFTTHYRCLVLTPRCQPRCRRPRVCLNSSIYPHFLSHIVRLFPQISPVFLKFQTNKINVKSPPLIVLSTFRFSFRTALGLGCCMAQSTIVAGLYILEMSRCIKCKYDDSGFGFTRIISGVLVDSECSTAIPCASSLPLSSTSLAPLSSSSLLRLLLAAQTLCLACHSTNDDCDLDVEEDVPFKSTRSVESISPFPVSCVSRLCAPSPSSPFVPLTPPLGFWLLIICKS